SYTDSKVLGLGLPKFFYRLKYNAPDGKVYYGEVREVGSLAPKKEISLIGHQQIGKNKYNIHFNARGKVNMSVINMLGQVKFKQKYQNLEGPKTIYLFTENWESGAYVIDLKQGQKRTRYKFVLP
ncbi:MAG: T9SS type A sorting domain-containing protein, partial [Bacteroidota bacterium]